MAPPRPGADTDPATRRRLRVADLARSRVHAFALHPDAAQCTALAAALDLVALRKVRLDGSLSPAEDGGWDLAADLGATVVQPCIATLAPVTTRIDAPVRRRFRTELPDEGVAGEVEMPEDETLELLPEVIDLDAVLSEALSLSLPDYPRAHDVPPADTAVTEPGKTPITDAEMRPFAGLADLKDRLKGGDGADSGGG